MEVIVNISLLMLAAILLIGFTMIRINEKNIIEEKVRYGEGMTQDVQTPSEFILRNKKEVSLSDPLNQTGNPGICAALSEREGIL